MSKELNFKICIKINVPRRSIKVYSSGERAKNIHYPFKDETLTALYKESVRTTQ